MKGEFSDFLSWHTDEAVSTRMRTHHAEMALNMLIKQHAKRFGELFAAYPDMGSLQKAFRQTDAFDSAEVDMAFWHLFHATRLVWEWETEGYEDVMAMKRITKRRSADELEAALGRGGRG